MLVPTSFDPTQDADFDCGTILSFNTFDFLPNAGPIHEPRDNLVMSQIARDPGLGRESLYKALSAEGNPEFATIMKVIAALGLQLHAAPSGTVA